MLSGKIMRGKKWSRDGVMRGREEVRIGLMMEGEREAGKTGKGRVATGMMKRLRKGK